MLLFKVTGDNFHASCNYYRRRRPASIEMHFPAVALRKAEHIAKKRRKRTAVRVRDTETHGKEIPCFM